MSGFTSGVITMRVTSMGYGKRCHVCKKVGDIRAFQVWQNMKLLRNIQLCVSCLEKSDVKAELPLLRQKEVNPIRTREAKERIRRSRQMEAALAEQVGGRAQPASGSSRLAGFKGDVRKIGSWRLEHKFTDALKYYLLKLTDLAKIINEAMDAGEYPALVIEFAKAKSSFAVIPLTLFLEFVNGVDNSSTPARRRPQKRQKRTRARPGHLQD